MTTLPAANDHSHHLVDAGQIRDFAFAGNAIFTVTSPTGTSFTFRVRRADPRPDTAPTWFVGVLSGPDNTAAYTYLGFVREGQYILGRKVGPEAPSQKAAAWLMPRIAAGRLPSTVEFRTSGLCGRCGRTLTTPESIDRGIGPECWRQLAEAA